MKLAQQAVLSLQSNELHGRPLPTRRIGGRFILYYHFTLVEPIGRIKVKLLMSSMRLGLALLGKIGGRIGVLEINL